ncbi:hypothetical protein D3C71_789150 [compost metagenome]
MPLPALPIQLDAGTQQAPAKVEVATLALVQQIQPRTQRKALVLCLQSIQYQMPGAPAQAGMCIHLAGVEQRQCPARVIAALGKQRQQRARVAHGKIRACVHLER